MLEGYVSVIAAAQIRGCDDSYIRRLCRDARVKAVKVGRDWLIDEQSVRDFRPRHYKDKAP